MFGVPLAKSTFAMIPPPTTTAAADNLLPDRTARAVAVPFPSPRRLAWGVLVLPTTVDGAAVCPRAGATPAEGNAPRRPGVPFLLPPPPNAGDITVVLSVSLFRSIGFACIVPIAAASGCGRDGVEITTAAGGDGGVAAACSTLSAPALLSETRALPNWIGTRSSPRTDDAPTRAERPEDLWWR